MGQTGWMGGKIQNPNTLPLPLYVYLDEQTDRDWTGADRRDRQMDGWRQDLLRWTWFQILPAAWPALACLPAPARIHLLPAFSIIVPGIPPAIPAYLPIPVSPPDLPSPACACPASHPFPLLSRLSPCPFPMGRHYHAFPSLPIIFYYSAH